jgi:hypothetical protein
MIIRLILLAMLASFATYGCSCSDDGIKDGDGDVDGEVPLLCPDGEPRGQLAACPDDGLVYSCGDGCDNDGDGLVDLDDPDCPNLCQDGEGANRCADGSFIGAQTVCQSTGLLHACGDGCDNDGDGLVDLDDPTCGNNPCHLSESVAAGGGGGGGFTVVPCDGAVYECGNTLDDDGDGLIDSDDPNCLGPCDNNEDGYYPEIPGGIGGAGGCTFDCYFDSDSGSGSTDCLWDVQCDPLSPGSTWGGKDCSFNESKAGIDCASHFDMQFEVRTTCQQDCEFRTPNGCDCFGCCLFPTEDDPNRYLFIGSRVPGTTNQFGCTYEEAIKPEGSPLCAPCTPVPSCLKGCGECEICLGKDTIPDHCTATDRCDEGVQVCGLPGDDPCESGFYCITGCCIFFGGVPG